MAAAPGVRRSELGEALRACRDAFIGVGVMSCMINLLYLTGSIFMLEVYDRVLPSRSVPTLIGLIVLAAGLYAAQGGLDLLRGRILGRVGTVARRGHQRPCVRHHRAPAAGGRQPQRGPAAAARSRQHPLVPRQHGTRCVLRSALAAVLSGDLLCVPLAARPDRPGRRHHPGDADLDHRVHVAYPGPRGHDAGSAAQRSGRHQPAQRRSAGRDGNVRTADQALGRGQRTLSGRQSARQRRRRRPWRDRQGAAHDAAVGRCSRSAPIS